MYKVPQEEGVAKCSENDRLWPCSSMVRDRALTPGSLPLCSRKIDKRQTDRKPDVRDKGDKWNPGTENKLWLIVTLS